MIVLLPTINSGCVTSEWWWMKGLISKNAQCTTIGKQVSENISYNLKRTDSMLLSTKCVLDLKKVNESHHSSPGTLEKCWSGENVCIQCLMENHSKVETTDYWPINFSLQYTVIQLQKVKNGMRRCPIHVWIFQFFSSYFQFNQRKRESYNRMLLLEKRKNKCKGKPAAHNFKRSEQQLSKWGE